MLEKETHCPSFHFWKEENICYFSLYHRNIGAITSSPSVQSPPPHRRSSQARHLRLGVCVVIVVSGWSHTPRRQGSVQKHPSLWLWSSRLRCNIGFHCLSLQGGHTWTRCRCRVDSKILHFDLIEKEKAVLYNGVYQKSSIMGQRVVSQINGGVTIWLSGCWTFKYVSISQVSGGYTMRV